MRSVLAAALLALPATASARLGEKLSEFVARVEKAGWKVVKTSKPQADLEIVTYQKGLVVVSVSSEHGTIAFEHYGPLTGTQAGVIMSEQTGWVIERSDDYKTVWKQPLNPAATAVFCDRALFVFQNKKLTDPDATALIEKTTDELEKRDTAAVKGL